MTTALLILLWAIRIYRYVLIARILIEMVVSFSRNFAPPRWFYYIAEPIFMVTDPPVKALRKMIPPIRMGGVALDVSVLVLFFGLILLEYILVGVFNAVIV
ncbi:YGGT family protein [Corynebacterium ciconiae DSM 44920]|uniref:YggT family protein n=1 Tax=Corynebacterium ciconiae TaxID=227319 RepID=UPI00037C5208|nr:YggT family protein [Corynebacterium ciconiae]WKD60791.1 YGGT family protein [Corynebacterium ciconiae DSM 44920]